MNYQQELDNLIKGMNPSNYLPRNAERLERNVQQLARRIERLRTVTRYLEAKRENLTKREVRIFNRYRGRIHRVTNVMEHRAHLAHLGKLRREETQET